MSTVDEHSRCENCEAPTTRSCSRCGQRICRSCAKDHPRRKYDDPPELWPKCVEENRTRRPKKVAWTQRRLRAAANAITAMLAGIEGEGDWQPNVTAEDLRGALEAVTSRLK